MKGQAHSFLSMALRHEAIWGMTAEDFEALRAAETQGRLPEPPALAQGAPGAAPEAAEEPSAPEAYAGAAVAGAGYLTTILQDQTPSGKSIALVNFAGTVISRAPAWAASWGYISPQLFAATVTALADNPNIGVIVIVMDSPGGTVSGTQEAADAVAYAARKKPGKVLGHANDAMLSAAYWVGAQCSQVLVSPTAMTGSIGVITSHIDFSKALTAAGIVVTFIRSVAGKARSQPYEPLSEEARAERQAMLNTYHGLFVGAVSSGRGIAKTKVAANLATGGVWIGAEAVSAGIADRVVTLSTLLGELTGKVQAPPKVEPEPAQPDPEEEEEDAAKATATAGGAAAAEGGRVQAFEAVSGSTLTVMAPDGTRAELRNPSGETVAEVGPGERLEYKVEGEGTYTLHSFQVNEEQQQPEATATAGAQFSSNQASEEATLTGEQGNVSQSEGTDMDIAKIRAKVAAGEPVTAEEEAALAAHFKQQRESASAGGAGQLDTSKLDPAVARALKDAQDGKAAAESKLAARVESDAVKAAEDKAESLGQPRSFGPTYRKVADALAGDPEALAAYEQSLNAKSAQEDLVKPRGSAQVVNGAAEGSLEQQLAAKARVKMNADASLTYVAACDAVLKEDRAFALRYAGS